MLYSGYEVPDHDAALHREQWLNSDEGLNWGSLTDPNAYSDMLEGRS